MEREADIGFIGLGVMGQNLVLNMNDHDFTVAVFNRTAAKVEGFLNGPAKDTKVIGTYSIAELVSRLHRPRIVMLMVKAGRAVESTVDQLVPHLEKGDIIIDGGNSNYQNSMQMAANLEDKGLLYVGSGVSGGEDGARWGPSLMPGGSAAAWPYVKEIFQAIAAKVADGTPCCDWVGEGGAGHFVKMVHNGIEYGDMQLICEAYDLMKSVLGMSSLEMSATFAAWNESELNSYLIEITRDRLAYTDADGAPLVDTILDTAGQKGTGKWTVGAALDSSVPLTLISEAVFARFLSALKDERLTAAKEFAGQRPANFDGDRQAFLEDIGQALYAAKIISYTQGYMLFRAASSKHGWNLNYGGIALMWRSGCIIRAAFLDKIQEAFGRNPSLVNLLLDPYFNEQIQRTEEAWRRVVSQAVAAGVPLPAMSSGLAFFDGYRRERLPANLLQAQRDYFGAHTYERIDRPRGEFFHTDWTGRGTSVTSGSYTV
jgi:6-phosphogluconate dehydrogenase